MVLQVGTTQFQSTAGQSSRQPVNTFVEPVNVLPETGLMGLAQTLSSINPTLQKIVGLQIDKAKQEGVLEGQNQILGSTPTEINKIKKELEKKEGKRFARNFIGGNIYTQYGIEKQIALNLGNSSKAKTKKFFDEYVVQFETKDGVIPMPLSQFDVGSEQFETALSDFNATQLTDTKGIRPEILNEHFFPSQNLALQEVFKDHQETRSEAKIGIFENSFSDSILINFRSINEDNDDINDKFVKLDNVQNNINNMVTYGLTDSVSPKKIVDYTQNNINTIISDYEDGELDWIEAEAEIYDLIDFVKELKVGPQQTRLGDFTDKDGSFNVMLKETFKVINDKKEEEAKFADLSEQSDIGTRLSQLDYNTKSFATIRNNANIISGLTKDYPDQIDFIKEKYADLNYNVDAWWLNFHKRYNNGEFKDKQQAKTTLYGFMETLGPAATKEDVDNFNRLFNYVDKNTNKGLFESRPELKRLVKQGDRVLSQRGLFTLEVKGQYVQQKFDLDEHFRLELDKWSIGQYANEEAKETKYQEIISNYKEDLRKIKSGKPASEGGYDYYNSDNFIFDPTSYEGEKEAGEILEGLGIEGGAFSEGGFTTVDVSSGDTLSGIANDLDTSVEAIKKANGMTTNEIQINDVLIIPEGITDPNKVDAPKFDVNKLITKKDHPFNPVREKHNFQVIYNIAKEIGIKYPELVAAQAMEETGFGKTQSAKNNFLGLKATSSEVARGESERKMTTEDRGQGRQPEEANFKTFDNIRAMMMQYKKQWNDNFGQYKGLVNANSIQEAIKMLQAEDYATNLDYDKNVLSIIDRAIKEGWF
tara:strand:- start:5415 stop:7865 length:2451 start_codon:yes stop_codon:yes gene_type:complete